MATQSAECHGSSRTASSVPRSTYKDILRYIFDSEECQIDSKESRSLREVVNELCTTEDEEFLTYFKMVEDDVQEVKEKKPKLLFKEMYKYSSSTLSSYLKGMPQDAIYNHPILWQMIVEAMFMQGSASTGVPKNSVQREFTVVEENAIYYAAGYVVRKELKKYRKADDDKGAALAGALNGMMGENLHSNIDATETDLDYVKTWTVENDRGKLVHVTNDAYRFFCALEEATYELLQDGISKQVAISQVMGNPVVDFYWNLITDGLKSDWSSQLLSEISTLWFTIRGFSVASKLLEDYKCRMKKNIKGTKGLRKELH